MSLDPLKCCPIYKSCSHVDGSLCYPPQCWARLQAISEAKEKKRMSSKKGKK